MWWKAQYGKSSGSHGTLEYFKSRLNRVAASNDPKKNVNACVDLIYTVMRGYFLACTCTLFGVNSIDEPLVLPPGIERKSDAEKLAFITRLAEKVVEQCSLIEGALTNETVEDKDDGVYNYTRILCHFGTLSLELRDAWHEGDGERVLRCW